MKYFKSIILTLILALVLGACGSPSELEPEPVHSAPKNEDYRPYIDPMVDLLSQAFDMVNITTQFEGRDVIFVVNVAKDGIANAAVDLKSNSDLDNSAYVEWVDKMTDLSESLLSDLAAEIENVHLELRVLDDVDVRNYANGNGYEVRSILEIFDSEITYELMHDKAPEASEYSTAITMGMENAVKKAALYLDAMAFSYEGLVKQLEFDKFTHEEAVYAADNCGADWNEQAALKAALYLDSMAFSRDGLIKQLEFDGFTHDQAVYGVNEVGY